MAQNTFLFFGFVLAVFLYLFNSVGRRSKHLPPGPPTLPLIGNLHQIPKERLYLKFNEWAKQYGGIYSIKLATRTTIVLTDRRLVKELMDKKSSVSSNRPQQYILDTLLYEGDDIIFMQAANPHWKIARKFMHQNFAGTVVEKQHMPLLQAESVQMIRDMILNPKDLIIHPKRFANSFMMSVAYGIRTPHAKISHMVRINKVLSKTTTLLQPGTLPPIDLFPFLYYLPERLLGNWHTQVLEVRNWMNDLYSDYLDRVVARRKEKGSFGSFADRLIEQQDELGWTWHGLYFMGGLMMEAGSDTTSGAISSFLLLMTKFPDAAKRAKDQVDSVIRDDRSPIWEDYDKLPLVNALVKETMRLRPLAPIGFPHCLSEDIWLDGMLLPKGSDIIVNALGLQLDSSRYKNPDIFDIDHFIGKSKLASEYANVADYEERDHYGYGVGRRLCPGIHLAERALFVCIAKIVWAFDILPGKDDKGNPIEPDISWETGYEGGIIVIPRNFPCELRIRSEKKKQTILREFREAEANIFPQYETPLN